MAVAWDSLRTRSSRAWLGALLFAVAAVGLAWARAPIEEALIARFGPPPAEMRERYEGGTGEAQVDHAGWNALLSKHVEPGGWVSYAGFQADADALNAYLERVAKAPFDALGRDAKLALLINAYNAFTIRLVLDHYPIESIRDIPESQRWKGRTWNVAGQRWTLDEIEHVQIRDHFREPRIHFALVCAAIGCPPLRREAYAAERLDAQLEAQAAYVHRHPRWLRFDASENTAHLTQLYRWYRGDFRKTAGSVLRFAADYSPRLRKALQAGTRPSIEWLPYDWSLNDVKRCVPPCAPGCRSIDRCLE